MTTAVLPAAYSSEDVPTETSVVYYIRVKMWNSVLPFTQQSIQFGCTSIGADVYGRKDVSKVFSISCPFGKKFAYDVYIFLHGR
jgi:hypothetical protein